MNAPVPAFAVIGDIEAELKGIDEKLRRLELRRQVIALDIFRGVPDALAEADKLGAEEVALRNRLQLLTDARVPAQRAADAESRRLREASRVVAAQAYMGDGEELVACSTRADDLARQLAAVLHERLEIARRMERHGFPEGQMQRDGQINNPAALVRALDAAGLGRFLPALQAAEGGATLESTDRVTFAPQGEVLRLLKGSKS